MGPVSSMRFLRAAGIGCALAAVAVLACGSARQATPRSETGSDPAASLPAGLAAAVSATLGGKDRRFAPSARDGGVATRGGGLKTVFRPDGAALQAPGGKMSWR